MMEEIAVRYLDQARREGNRKYLTAHRIDRLSHSVQSKSVRSRVFRRQHVGPQAHRYSNRDAATIVQPYGSRVSLVYRDTLEVQALFSA